MGNFKYCWVQHFSVPIPVCGPHSAYWHTGGVLCKVLYLYATGAQFFQKICLRSALLKRTIDDSLVFNLEEYIGDGGLGVQMIDIPGFTINKKLAEGACAEIYAAVDQSNGKLVAIKILHARHFNNKAEVKRLADEGALCMRLPQHDNVVQTYKFGTVNKLPYVVLEYIIGRTLRELVVEKRAFSDIDILKLAKDLSRALRHLHNAGVCHKDLKPDNIMITREGMVKVLDFGFSENVKSFSLFGRKIEGSPAYMAPELFTSKKATPATDIYALGCTLFEAATGTPPFTGMSHSEGITLQANMGLEAPSLSRTNRQIGIMTEKMILTALQKDISRRYKSADEVLMDLARNQGWKTVRGPGSHRLAVGLAN